ncbi:neuroligin-4, Y-linked-like isoform X2 [Oratosquilla oratoria]|uniref:neuroligin-4, Y-linked-like isoform X2 n=1 Tax=Oratosquilla oratoria TaxID=337810 RepID=UPI003F775169
MWTTVNISSLLMWLLLLVPKSGCLKDIQKTPVIDTKYGKLQGFYQNVTDEKVTVMTYLGVPYATPPVGVNRFSPTRTLSQWVGVEEATSFGPVCPQKLPDIHNEKEALKHMNMEELERLRRYYPLLIKQSEDCLNLNIYVPYRDSSISSPAIPVLVFVHGDSYLWGSGNLYDGSILAALGRVIVVTVNYRLGILGFFNPNVDPYGRASVTNYGLMDQIAALHWIQENIVKFGGDPGQVTVMGHGTGAACVNFLVISPAVAGAGLFKRVILMSGSAVSSWAIVHEPVYYAVQIATELGCDIPDDLYLQYEVLLHCLRNRTFDQIIKVDIETPQFLSTIGPSIDGVTIKPDYRKQISKIGAEGNTNVDILFGVSKADMYSFFSHSEILNGFESEYRDKILRTYVWNNYRYHRQEIVLAIIDEYTDWDRPVQHPVNIRDLMAEALHDATVVSPMIANANQLWTPHRKMYFYVLDYLGAETRSERQTPPQSLSELVYVFGVPLRVDKKESLLVPSQNFTRIEIGLSEEIIRSWTNFVKTGDPNEVGNPTEAPTTYPNVGKEKNKYRSQKWEPYDKHYRKFLELDGRGRMKDHYRAHRVALWQWFIPELEHVGERYGADSPFHRFPDHDLPDTYSGPTRPHNYSREHSFLPPPTLPPSTTTRPTTAEPSYPGPTLQGNYNGAHPHQVNSTQAGLLDMPGPRASESDLSFPYTTALSLTIAIGCSLLILNILIFAGVYYKRDAAKMGPKHRSGEGGVGGSGNVSQSASAATEHQLLSSMESFKQSPSHCGTLKSLKSTGTLKSNIANSYNEADTLQIRDWPPDYSNCCQSATNPQK